MTAGNFARSAPMAIIAGTTALSSVNLELFSIRPELDMLNDFRHNRAQNDFIM